MQAIVQEAYGAPDELRLLERRFNGVPESYHDRVLAADAAQLDTWIDAVLDAENIEAVFERPTAH